MKMFYEAPEMKISMYQFEDVIVASENDASIDISIDEGGFPGGSED